MKCSNSFCKREVYEGGANLCLKCEEFYLDACLEAKYEGGDDNDDD